METQFQYERISKRFLDSLAETVLSGESIVILGPRYSGKSWIMNRLQERLSSNGQCLISLRFSHRTSVGTEQEAKRKIASACEAAGVSVPDGYTRDGLFGPIDEGYRQQKKPLLVVASDIDAIPHHLSRLFLQGLRSRVEERKLVAVLSGEIDLRDLVHGPNSEFNCTRQFVVQGFDRDLFHQFVTAYCSAANIEFSPDQKFFDRLYELTGGNVYLLKLVLWSTIESRVSSDGSGPHRANVSDLPDSLEKVDFPGAHIFSHARNLISKEPYCWEQLEQLRRGETVGIGFSEYAPTPLELAGVAIREGDRLCFPSQLMKDFVQRYYDDRRLADLHARDNQWEEAFQRYALLEPERLIRPASIDDREEIETTVDTLCSALHFESTKGIEALNELLSKGARFVLGFDTLTFWKYQNGWQEIAAESPVACQEISDSIKALLPSGKGLSPGWLPIRQNPSVVAAILPALRADESFTVVIGNLQNGTAVSRERKRLAKKLLDHFVEAYSHANKVAATTLRLQVRNRHIEIINSIFEAMGSEVLDVGQALVMAARGLRGLGYKRVLFSLVDPEQKFIEGVLDDSDDKTVNVAELTKWPLDAPDKDLQPHVINGCRAEIIPDARIHPLVNQNVVQRARMRALAIVPILNRTGDAIGAIHVERTDGLTPSQDEVNDLLDFGRQLAVAIEQSERVNFLQATLHSIPSPVVVIDRLERVRYANRPAADLLGVRCGWTERDHLEVLPQGDEALEYLRKSLLESQRLARHVIGIGWDQDYRGQVLCNNIEDWRRDRTVGAFLHIHGLNDLFRVFEAFRIVAEANDTESAEKAMLQATEQLQHKWGRLYLVDEEGNRLVSRYSFGFENPSVEAQFNRGEIWLEQVSGSNADSWRCLEQRTPIVFCWKETLAQNSLYLTPQGLECVNVQNPSCPECIRKEPGDFWIDFPLQTSDKPLGKLTLDCSESFRPERFEALKVLAEMTSGLLDAFRRSHASEERERWISEAAERSIALTAHNLATRLGGLPNLLARYRRREKDFDGLAELNNDFKHVLDQTYAAIQRSKNRLAKKPILSCEQCDLIELLEKALVSKLHEDHWKIESKEPRISAHVDTHMLEAAIIELIHNSLEICKQQKDLRIHVTVKVLNKASEDWAEIIYSDNGPGVPRNIKEEIFGDFFSRRPGKKSGTGLGLGFARRVVEAHGGSIAEKGKEGEGARFVIKFPRYITQSGEEK